ncbi:hypothetical protein PGT21_001180 [Puccinia graminis f. sp. tritici]|uniref:Uncharacterized protein n=1 Tax=Puccinia graminis f. sp. tritici TaxID=56615 RepID=A0A5B0LJY6_PUCGR|nr:hypothetical protein PGT21_001180 [Puccinia graminis f. sp. tritici]
MANGETDPIQYGIGRFIGSDRFFNTRYRKIRDRITKGDPIPWYRIEMVSDRDRDRIAIPIRHPNAAGCMPYTWVSSKLPSILVISNQDFRNNVLRLQDPIRTKSTSIRK